MWKQKIQSVRRIAAQAQKQLRLWLHHSPRQFDSTAQAALPRRSDNAYLKEDYSQIRCLQ